MGDEFVDEENPLLAVDCPKKRLPTPLPKLQLAIVLLLQVCEPITSQSIYPYINQLITELGITGGDDRKVGYYAGLIESLFFATEAVTVFQWSRLSDHIGRKPVILIGLLGTTVSMLAFGLSRTFGALILSRCLTGLLNGNTGVMKSLMGELTDSTNRAEGYALVPLVCGFGVAIGPLIGGSLPHPHERFSNAFSGSFWKEYPYFLPCLVTASYVAFALLVALVMLKEPPPTKKSSLERCNSSMALLHDKPLPLHKVLTYPVILTVANYVAVAFLEISAVALLPLFFAMPLDIGGLDFSPSIIGYIMGTLGLVDAIFQVFFFAPIVRRWGERNTFIFAMSTFIPIFLIFPLINFVARGWGALSLGIWLLIGILLALFIFMDLAFGVIFIFMTAAAPNRRSLGTTNGLAQTTVCITRAIGPALSTSLFSLSVENNILGGFGVYVALAALSVFAVYFATYLPSKLWDQDPDIDMIERDNNSTNSRNSITQPLFQRQKSN